MRYFELACKVYIKEEIPFSQSFEILSRYISYSMYQGDLGQVHQHYGFKYYTFSGMRSGENERIYKQGYTYDFTIRSLDEHFIDVLSILLRQNINNKHLLVVQAEKKRVEQFFISELYSVTPTIVSVSNGLFWTFEQSGDVIHLQRLLHENAEKKYKSFYETQSTEIAALQDFEPMQNFIQLLEIKNHKPQNILIHKEGKPIRFFGNKFRIVPNEDPISQKIAFTILACGLGEKNSYGGGFCVGRRMK